MNRVRTVGATLLTLFAIACAARSRSIDPAIGTPGQPGETTAGEQAGAPGAREPLPETGAGSRVASIAAHASETGTVVTITGSQPISYTSFDPDPTTLVLEMPDTDVSSLQPIIEVNTPQLARINVAQMESASGARHARIELIGRMSQQTSIEPSAEGLSIVLTGVSDTAAQAGTAFTPAHQAAGEPGAAQDPTVYAPGHHAGSEPAQDAAAATPEASSIEPATQLTAVHVTGEENQPDVTLEGDGSLTYEALTLADPHRLVLDIKGVRNQVRGRKFQIENGGVERVRVSQFATKPEPITRVVFDLSAPVQHHMEQGDRSITVHFNAPQADMAAPAQADPAAQSAETAMADAQAGTAPGAPETMPDSSAQTPAPAMEMARPAEIQQPSAAPEVRPAAKSLNDMGSDVVLFEQTDPGRSRKQSSGGASTQSRTIPMGQTTYESRTIAGGRRNYRGEKISVAFRDADLREVMFFFADVMKMNLVLDPDVVGKVDIRLNQVPWDQAFQVILKNQGLDAIEEENVVRIAKTSKLRQEASDLRSLKQAQEQAVDPVTFTRTLSYAKVQDTMQVLQQIRSDRGKIVADVRTNTLVISDIPEKRIAYDGLLDALDTQTPQVMIEARIVEAIRNFERDIGVNWRMTADADPAIGTGTNQQFPHRVNFVGDVNTAPPGFPSAGGIGLMLGNVLDSFTLDIQLEAFEADGRVRILSSPKLTTQNNQPATIEQGVQIPVVTTTATEVDVQYVPASLRLIVTPQITAEDTVIMKLKVENNQPSATVSVSDVPGIVTEAVDTQILVRTGTTAVIGGVYKLQETENETGLPGLRKIPFFGWLFKNKVNRKSSSELLVFITPKIVKNI